MNARHSPQAAHHMTSFSLRTQADRSQTHASAFGVRNIIGSEPRARAKTRNACTNSSTQYSTRWFFSSSSRSDVTQPLRLADGWLALETFGLVITKFSLSLAPSCTRKRECQVTTARFPPVLTKQWECWRWSLAAKPNGVQKLRLPSLIRLLWRKVSAESPFAELATAKKK